MQDFEGWLHIRPIWRVVIVAALILMSLGLWQMGMFWPEGWGVGIALLVVWVGLWGTRNHV